MRPQVEFAQHYRYLFSSSADDLPRALTVGATDEYSGDEPAPPRTRGPPYRMDDADNTLLIMSKLLKDVAERRMFTRAANVIGLDERIEATHTTTAEKQNPDRPISADRRSIAHFRMITCAQNRGSSIQSMRRQCALFLVG